MRFLSTMLAVNVETALDQGHSGFTRCLIAEEIGDVNLVPITKDDFGIV